ncbi:MAG: ABC transporter ATP-binding protein [Candidatus Odinarchaeota archaeon]
MASEISTSVTLKNLTIKYGKTDAVNNLDLEIKHKELFVLLGPSGCGKTTTLMSIAGLIKPVEGKIWLGDELVTDAAEGIFERPQDRNIAVVFQDYAIYPHMTVYQNIAFPLETHGISKIEIEKKVTDVAQRLNIDHLLERKPKQLSGGQRQRVALGRAIVREPKVFLMDEPLSNLDAKLRVYARAELKKIHETLGATIIYVTHDQMEAMSIGNRIAILNDGALEQLGTPEEVYDKPNNLFVAGFIGYPPINMLDANLVEKGDRISVSFGSEFPEYSLSDGKKIKSRAKSSEIVVGIRPEHVKISKEPRENAVKAKIEVIEPAGREYVIHLVVEKKKPLIAVVDSDILDSTALEEVYLLLDEKKFHIFDEKTEKNIRL